MKSTIKTKKQGFNMKLAVLCMSILFSLLFVCPSFIAYAAKADEEIKVGFFSRNGYHMMDEDGAKSGYGYEVLQLIGRYSDLTYEYIGYEDCTRKECLEMLQNGEIDLMTSLHAELEGMKDFLYSKIDIGTCSTMITVKAGNLDIKAGNYDTYDGIRIGILYDDPHEISLNSFAKEQGFSYKPVYFSTVAAIVEALNNGEIDATATGSIRALYEEEWYVESFHEEKIYAVVRKDDKELIETINNALEKLDYAEADWRLRLLEKYFPKDLGNVLNFTAEEREYLKRIQAPNVEFKVLVNPDRYPYSYLEDDEYKGIMIDVFEHLADMVGIKYKYVMARDRESYVKLVNMNAGDICIDCGADYSTAEMQGFRISDPYIFVNFAWVYRTNRTQDIQSAAVLSNSAVSNYTKKIIEDAGEDVDYIEYDSEEEALKAILKGEVDGFSTNLLNAEKIIWEDASNKLQSRIKSNAVYYTIGIDHIIDSRLLSMFNRAIKAMDDEFVESVYAKYSDHGERPFSFERMLNEYPWMRSVLVVSLLIFLVLIVYIVLQNRYGQKLRTEMDKTEKASRAKAEFISRMSHDIRTPINGIVGMIEIARRNIDDKARIQECLIKMMIASKHLTAIVADVLDISQLEDEKHDEKEAPFHMLDQMEYCKDVISGKMYGRDLTFECDFQDIKHPHLIGVEVYLNKILLSIMDNSVKFTKDGGKVQFQLREKEISNKNKAAFVFEISDTGIGMSKEFVDKICEPFEQESVSSRTTFEGTGLGMAIVKRLLDKMGGTIEVESELGVGTKVTLYIEFEIDKTKVIPEEVEVQESVEEVTETSEDPDDLSGLTVLIVDDIELNIDIVQSILEDEGAKTLAAYDGAEALDIFNSSEIGAIDCILMDIRMPVMDGIEATKAIRSLDRADAQTVAIYALTANSLETDANKTKEAGMNGHMNKPVDVLELLTTVASCRQ